MIMTNQWLVSLPSNISSRFELNCISYLKIFLTVDSERDCLIKMGKNQCMHTHTHTHSCLNPVFSCKYHTCKRIMCTLQTYAEKYSFLTKGQLCVVETLYMYFLNVLRIFNEHSRIIFQCSPVIWLLNLKKGYSCYPLATTPLPNNVFNN